MRGAAAHLWWSYYRTLKKREGVIGAQENPNAVLNNVAVAKRSPGKAKIATAKASGSRK
jgi:DNA-3-methyladenine glycosylase II